MINYYFESYKNNIIYKDILITAVILNWKRSEGVEQICRQLNDFELISEIIVWNNNPEMQIHLDEEKARVINCDDDFGLFTRFAAASLAKNECILFHDDDITAPESTLRFLYEKWRQSPDRCHTAFGRNPKNGEYSMNTQYGPVEITLTRYVMTHRCVAVHALSKTPQFADIPGVPVGNGEDIILSYASSEISGKLNIAYQTETKDLYEEDEHAINTRFPDHIAHRTRIIERCKEVFTSSKGALLHGRIYQFLQKVGIVIKRKKISKKK